MSDRLLTRKKTIQRHQAMSCKIFELKVDHSKLSNKSVEHLSLLFREAKWFYNYILSLPHVNDADTTKKTVDVLVKDHYEEREFHALMAHMKQAMKTRTYSSIKTLHTLKTKKKKVGKLKFKSFIGSIPLLEFGRDYNINQENNTVRLSGLKQKLKVFGLEQITLDMEIANALIIKKENDYYFHITTFQNKEKLSIPETCIGIDFGCTTQLTFSNGVKLEFQVPVSKRIKRLDRKIDKKVNGKVGKNRGSKNRRKLQAKRRKEYERLTHKRADIRNKVVSAIVKNYKYVCFQDESIAAWQAAGHGKKVQFSGIGGILSALKNKALTPVLVSKWFPSTKQCPQCGHLTKTELSDRVYVCEACSFTEDRDVKSAKCILVEGMKNFVPMDYRDIKPEENLPSVFFETLMKVSGVKVYKTSSLSQEATGLAPS